MKIILPMAGILAASIAAAPAASIIVDTVGTINGNARTPVLQATGNSLTSAQFAMNIATAFAANTGGVWNFDEGNASGDIAVGQTITLNYGVSLANNVVLTLGGDSIRREAQGEATSGGFVLALPSNGATTRTYTPDKLLLTVGFFNTDRNDSGRTSVLTVTYQDNTTASTSGANADDVYFHGLSGTELNPIKSFAISQNNFVRYDDLGIIVVPEPSSALLLGLAGLGVFIRRRR